MLGFLAFHLQMQNGKGTSGRQHSGKKTTGGETSTYKMGLPTDEGTWNCPVERCTGRAATRTAMQVHFFHRHVQDTVIILEEGNLPQLWGPHCNMLVPWSALNRRQLATYQCAKGI